VQQRRRRQHCTHWILVLYVFASTPSSSSSSAGISGFSRHPLSLAISEAPPPIYLPASPFLHVNLPGAPLPALPPRLPLRGHPLPACTCVHNIADVQHHSPKVGQAVVSHRCPSVAHHAHGTHVPPSPVVPVAASPPLRLPWRPLMKHPYPVVTFALVDSVVGTPVTAVPYAQPASSGDSNTGGSSDDDSNNSSTSSAEWQQQGSCRMREGCDFDLV
jgi:hypothetical protein